MSTDISEPLILRRRGITDRIDGLFEAISRDAALRERFVKNPAQVLSEHVDGVSLPEQEASATNQLVYAVLSNQPLREWLQSYAEQRQGAPPSRSAFMDDFTQAVLEHGGDHAILEFIRNSATPHSPREITGDHFITSGTIFVDGFAFSAHSSNNATFHAIQSFQHSSEFDHTGGTSVEVEQASKHYADREGGVYGSGCVRVAIDALVRYATELHGEPVAEERIEGERVG
ncbi:hypothetical protein ACIGDI_28385 [Streptomyces sp. NPDC085900]|uniref:hypothetical protein n=1 Tax=Streptomyces sp. NPDC085900 TaxID=3365737 RepID=UPI0037D0483C